MNNYQEMRLRQAKRISELSHITGYFTEMKRILPYRIRKLNHFDDDLFCGLLESLLMLIGMVICFIYNTIKLVLFDVVLSLPKYIINRYYRLPKIIKQLNKQ